MRPLLLASLVALTSCSGAGCMEGMANTCRLLGGSPDQAALYRSANPGMFLVMPQYAPVYQPAPAAPRPVNCSTYRLGHTVQTQCQ